MTLRFRMPWFKCIFTNTDTGENDQNLYVTKRESGAHSNSPGRGNLYRLHLHLLCTDFGVVFVTADISSNFKMPEPHDLCSVLPTAPLCSRDGDGCHFERTAAQWLGVRPGYPQVRNGSVLRWILCAAVGWMHSELLFLTLCTHDHSVSDCRIEMCGRKWKVDLSCGGLRTFCVPDEWILIQTYLQLFIILIITRSKCLTSN